MTERKNGNGSNSQNNTSCLLYTSILTADGSSRIIDYEWIFDFPVPVDFVYYRAVLALSLIHILVIFYFQSSCRYIM